MMKMGLKRKFYTTTHTANSSDSLFTPAESISTQTEPGRQIKKRKCLTEDGLFHEPARLSSQPPPSGANPQKKLNGSLKACNDILKELFSPKHSGYAWPFYKSVNAVLPKLHDFHDNIKQPMDLETIKQKMDNRKYTRASEFAADMRLIFRNCYEHNPPDHDVVAMARKLQDVFVMRYTKIHEETLDGAVGLEKSSTSSTSEASTSSDSESDNIWILNHLQEQLKAVQDQLRKLEQASTVKLWKRMMENEKEKEKMVKKPDKHLSLVKKVRSSVVSDTVGARLANGALGAEDVNIPTNLNHNVSDKKTQDAHHAAPEVPANLHHSVSTKKTQCAHHAAPEVPANLHHSVSDKKTQGAHHAAPEVPANLQHSVSTKKTQDAHHAAPEVPSNLHHSVSAKKTQDAHHAVQEVPAKWHQFLSR
jgi:hypothetical protein